MKRSISNTLNLIGLVVVMSSCDFVKDLEEKSKKISQYEKVSLKLARENRLLKTEIGELKFKIKDLESQKQYLSLKLSQKEGGRSLASVPQYELKRKKDLVKFDVYKWNEGQIVAMGNKAFKKKNYEKSSQFFYSLLKHYPQSKLINDRVLFQAGVSAYQTGDNNPWVFETLERLISEYPSSQYYRGAKLWIALTQLKEGKEGQFFNTVEEFRKKYRNTPEWKILSKHYEEFVHKYKK